ncbi:MAG: type IV secretion system DNA-binding domain-containing protein [Planctomycetes bacterium]|nr:type IV secretion system DNA-binding domain-containing protein [Planctomycetota bacterium]
MQDTRTYLGRANWRDRRKPFGLKQRDRLHHLYIIGQTGTGKSTLLETLMVQDVVEGRGFAFLDPHGDTVERVVARASALKRGAIVYLDAPSATSDVGFNPLESVPVDQRALAASGIVEAFKGVWGQWWGPRLEHIFRNALLTLLDQPTATLADLPRLFSDERYRSAALANVRHGPVRDFWIEEFSGMGRSSRSDALGPLRNKLGAFLSQPSLYRIMTRERSSFDLREMMDHGGALLVNLAKGRMGADASSLLGALLVTRLSLAALSRADVSEPERRNFFVYLDEFQNFTTLTVATMLSELRKYHVGLTLAHQFMGQVVEDVRGAILGNAGTMVSFRVGPQDAALLKRYFAPEFSELDLMYLPNYSVYLRLMVDGVVSSPFSADTLPPPT